MRSDLRRVTLFKPPFHKIHEDPAKNYGVHSLHIYLAVVGEKGAMQWSFTTGTYKQETLDWWASRGLKAPIASDGMGFDLAAHTRERRDEYDYERDDCEFLGGGKCFCNGGSALAGGELYERMVENGEDPWEMLEAEYARQFEGAK